MSHAGYERERIERRLRPPSSRVPSESKKILRGDTDAKLTPYLTQQPMLMGAPPQEQAK